MARSRGDMNKENRAPSAEDAVEFILETNITEGVVIQNFLRTWQQGSLAELHDEYPDFIEFCKGRGE